VHPALTLRRRAATPRSPRLAAERPDIRRHLDWAAAHFGDPRVARWHWPGPLGGSRTREQVRERLRIQAAQCARDGYTLWMWRELASGDLVGQIGLQPADVEGEHVIEVGWSVAPERWGEGFATDAARVSLEWGFERAGLREIASFAMVDNAPSLRVMEKLGMTYERDFPRAGVPHALYRLRREDWH
jgi:[ribosomal protein S5]-alanine N-acetyltransferase